jgi:glycosyltransferase involved in cell wall biosynthesis
MKASILFIAYNQSRYVAEAIRSAMAQDYSDLELVVCDDASTDDTRLILEEELASCPPQITVVRAHSDKNGGLLANFNRGMANCSGDLIIAMAGDDVSRPDRVSAIVEQFSKHPECMLVFSNWQRIDAEGGILPGGPKNVGKGVFTYGSQISNVYGGSPVYGAAAAYRADLFKTFGPMMIGHHPEDRCYWVRALLLGEVRYLPQVLLDWRMHGTNLSNSLRMEDSMSARKKMARQMLFKQHYALQHTRDIQRSLEKAWITRELASRLFRLLEIDRERQRLRRYSLMEAPWKLWLASARRLVRRDGSFRSMRHILISDGMIRLFPGRRKGRWARKFS